MRKLLLTTLFLGSVSGILAQTGSMVREDRVWNYMTVRYANWDGEATDTIPDCGYHFEGRIEKEGKTYLPFCNGAGEEVALMRQEGGEGLRLCRLSVRYPGGDSRRGCAPL